MSVTDNQRRVGTSRVSTAAAVLAVIACALTAFAASAHDRLFHFDIRQQPLSQALRTYARTCGQEVIFTPALMVGTGTTSLVGDYSAEVALPRLLAGTDLVAERSPSGALMIRRRSLASVAGAHAGVALLRVADSTAVASDPPATDPPPTEPPAQTPAPAAVPPPRPTRSRRSS